MSRFIYSILLYALAPFALLATAARGIRDPAYRDRLPERMGFTRVRPAAPPIWVHAVSVGEVQAAAPLIRALVQRHPECSILVTTATPTGAARVLALFGSSVSHAYLPYDLPGAVHRFLERTRPVLAVVMEREVWPNLFRACRLRRIPLLIASARISERSAHRHGRFLGLFSEALSQNVTVAAQSEADAARFRQIGARDVRVAGNVKFDIEILPALVEAGEAFRVAQFAGRPVWVAGSTHEGEEDIVLDAHRRVRSQRRDALLVLVPRHPNRFTAVRSWLSARGVSYASRSAGESPRADTSVLLVDTLGELTLLYAAADVAFVGGSLVPIGGHNLLEPAALGRPILTGPHTFNGEDVAERMLAAGAAIEVSSAEALASAVLELFGDSPRRAAMAASARGLLESNRGALDRLLAIIDVLKQGTPAQSIGST